VRVEALIKRDDWELIREFSDVRAVLFAQRRDRVPPPAVARGRERVYVFGVDRDDRQVKTLLPRIARLVAVTEFPRRLVEMAERIARR
jgi:hypothetical protein